MTVWREWEIHISVDQVLRGQGAEPAVLRRRRPELVEIAEWALAEGLPLIQPAVISTELPVEQLRHEKLFLEGGKSLSGPLIGEHLGGAQRVAVMVCTLGSQLEELVAGLMHSDPLHGVALEGVGGAAIEALTVEACRVIEEHSRQEGLKTTIPLSPGMVGWPVDSGQRQIFSVVDAGSIGVLLNSSSMMSPRLSLSQVVGIGTDVSAEGRTCDYCSLKATCRYQDHYAHTI